jgi:hypothetical protein
MPNTRRAHNFSCIHSTSHNAPLSRDLNELETRSLVQPKWVVIDIDHSMTDGVSSYNLELETRSLPSRIARNIIDVVRDVAHADVTKRLDEKLKEHMPKSPQPPVTPAQLALYKSM